MCHEALIAYLATNLHYYLWPAHPGGPLFLLLTVSPGVYSLKQLTHLHDLLV